MGDEILKDPDMGAVNNRLRIQIRFKPTEWLSLHTAYDIYPRIQDSRLFEQGLFLRNRIRSVTVLMIFPIESIPGSDITPQSFGLFQNLDRFYFTLKFKFGDIFLGRQAIAWGSARIINPTDIIAPFSFNELDTEERRGWMP